MSALYVYGYSEPDNWVGAKRFRDASLAVQFARAESARAGTFTEFGARVFRNGSELPREAVAELASSSMLPSDVFFRKAIEPRLGEPSELP
jgi:hypothetical protein